jgi:hypothetical protein
VDYLFYLEERIMTILHEDLQKVFYADYSERGGRFNAILHLIREDQAQYTALVNAAIAWNGCNERSIVGHFGSELMKTIKPFIKHKLSEKLDELADDTEHHIGWDEVKKRIRQHADEARNLEWELEQ